MQLVLAMSDNILYMAFSLKICFIISQGQICATDAYIFESYEKNLALFQHFNLLILVYLLYFCFFFFLLFSNFMILTTIQT